MASKFPEERGEKVKLHTRKGHDMTWSCDIHGEPIKFYCKEHNIPICHPCATKDHGQKPCELDDIGDVILERRRKLDSKRLEIEKAKKQLKTLDSKIQSIDTFSSNHFLSVNDELKVTSEDKLKIVKDNEGDKIRSINEKADEEIRIINKWRGKLIKSCNEEAEQQQVIIKESHEKFLSEAKELCEMCSTKIKYLTRKSQHAISSMDSIDASIKRIEQEDKTLVNEAPHVLASLDDSLNVHQSVSDCLDLIQREVQRVKFVEGEVGGEHYGRIDGYIVKWELVKSIHIPSFVNSPWVCGSISGDEICVQNVQNNATYVTNISTEHTQNVIEGGSNMYITSCAPIDSNVIVCGKGGRDCTGDSLDGCITLYDRQWKVIRNISIPRNNELIDEVYVDVDRDGMILAAQCIQSNIYVINPADGKIVNTITMQGKDVMHEIQALSSGDIVVDTGLDEFTIISRSGEEKAVLHCNEWELPCCYVDRLTDTLYITYLDIGETIYVVDQVSCDGIIQAKRIVEFVRSARCKNVSPCLVTHFGNLVACDGDKLFLYKKSFIV